MLTFVVDFVQIVDFVVQTLEYGNVGHFGLERLGTVEANVVVTLFGEYDGRLRLLLLGHAAGLLLIVVVVIVIEAAEEVDRSSVKQLAPDD